MVESMEMEKPIIYTHKGKRYRIEDESAERLLSDFLHCEEKGDWLTINNRITNGTMWGWLIELTSDENQAQLRGEMSLKDEPDALFG